MARNCTCGGKKKSSVLRRVCVPSQFWQALARISKANAVVECKDRY